MHDAYEVVPILEKLPLQIESITAYGESGWGEGARLPTQDYVRGDKTL